MDPGLINILSAHNGFSPVAAVGYYASVFQVSLLTIDYNLVLYRYNVDII